MLKRMYVNNYRCLVNFEIEFDAMTLLLGRNGSGKTSLLDILHSIRRLIVDGDRVGEAFSPDDMTVWLDSKKQTFELLVEGNGGLYDYKLVLEYNDEEKRLQIESETLSHNDKPLFDFFEGKVVMKLFGFSGDVYLADSTRSALTVVADNDEIDKINWFKKWIEKLFILSIQPKSMSAITRSESSCLSIDGTNFASWYRYLSQEHQNKIPELFNYLKDSIQGFDSFRLEAIGNSKKLKVGFASEDNPYK